MPRWVHLLAVTGGVLFAGIAQAQTYSCSAARPPNYTQTYSSVSNASTLLNVTVTCRRRGNGPALSINYTLTPDNGLYAIGAQNRAERAGQYINYDLYAGSCIAPWSGAGTITLPGAGRNASISQTLTYYGCVPASQPVLPAAGNYTDTVGMTLAVTNPVVTITGANPQTFNATIRVNAACAFSTFPGSVNFGTYTAFQGSANTANTSFATSCTNLTPYTLSLDATGGVVSGLNYSLLLNTTASGGTHPFGPVSGTGVPQTYYINGTMPANQAGTCSTGTCAGSQAHTLTVSY